MEMIRFLVASFLLMQSGNIRAKTEDGKEGLAWTKLDTSEKCRLVRAVLEMRRNEPPIYVPWDSSYVRRMATSRGRKVVGVTIGWDVGGIYHAEPFPAEGGAATCGWTDVSFASDLTERERDASRDLWKMNVALYLKDDGEQQAFAFWMQLVPLRRQAKTKGVLTGCPPEYGFVTRAGNGWTVVPDKSARAWVPRK